jgi:indolepyruvate decarboxylase
MTPTSNTNDIACWRYAEPPQAFGFDDWFTARVSTCGEFDQAPQRASRGDTAAYIEVVTVTYAASPMSIKLHETSRRSTTRDARAGGIF